VSRWYEIGGLRLRVDGEVFERDLLAERYHPFEATEGPADLRVEIHPVPGFQNRAVAEGRAGDDPYVLRDGVWTIHRLDYEATLVGPGHLRARTDGTLGALNGLLRHLLVWALHERKGLLLHAAGIRVGAGIRALAGPSGAGKTTACRHAPSWAMVLGDEHLVVLPRDDGLWAWGTPIVGELARPGNPAGGPLQSIDFIEHAHDNVRTALDIRETARRLIGCTVFYPFGRDRNALALEACASTAARVAAYRLRARGDGSFWELFAPPDHAGVPG